MPRAARAARDVHDRAGEPAPAEAPRRTVTITGRPDRQTAARHLTVVPQARPAPPLRARASRVVQIERRRPRRQAAQRLGSQPDRLAMWAVLMALFLIAVTALSSHL